jgi:hypothetical protein
MLTADADESCPDGAAALLVAETDSRPPTSKAILTVEMLFLT